MSKYIIPPKNGLTDVFVKNLKAQDKAYEIQDRACKGLRIKVSPVGTKTFVTTIYASGDRYPNLSLGRYPNTCLSDAREKLLKWKAQAKDGVFVTPKVQKQLDAKAKRIELEQQLIQTRTVDECLIEFEKNIIQQRKQPKSALKLIDSELRGNRIGFNCSVILSELPVREVTLDHIKLLIYSIRDRGAIVQAKKTFDMIKQFFRWCLGQNYIEKLPYQLGHDYNKSWGLSISAKPDRALDVGINGKHLPGLPEITNLFQVLDNECDLEVRNSAKILLFTGVRSKELFLAEKEHINLDEHEWFIPAENTKTDNTITIPLSDFVTELFEQLIAQSPSKYVVYMGGKNATAKTRRMDHVINGPNGIRNRHKIGDYWTLHTLRKTLRSHISKWCSFETAERCLNHSLGKLADVYDHASDFEQRKQALQQWSDAVCRATYGSESNVFPLRGL